MSKSGFRLAGTDKRRRQRRANQQRAEFWTFLLSGVAEFESGFDPNARYIENSNDAEGRLIVSSGLLQISFESANAAAYGCHLADPAQLFDPLINLTCGVRVMRALALQDGVISRITAARTYGGALYWSTLRPNHQRHPLENIQHWCSNYRCSREEHMPCPHSFVQNAVVRAPLPFSCYLGRGHV